ncbi:MAG: hypothetical protein ACJ8FO_05300 [Sphingomicrobium sp.]
MTFGVSPFGTVPFAAGPTAGEVQKSINSADWTGVAERLTRERKDELQQQLESLRACIRQSELDERTKANIGKRLDAVRELIEAPDPPWKLIVEILNDPVLTAFLNFGALMTIILGNF